MLFFFRTMLFAGNCQSIPVTNEQQLENLLEAEQSETEDDYYLQQLEQFRKNPLNLNEADAPELKELRMINDLQIENLIVYRRLFGKLISIYELQAIPTWDPATIRKLLPFITLAIPFSAKENFKTRIKEGEHSLLIRVSQQMELSGESDSAKYKGSPLRMFFRYRYAYKNLFQFGMIGDKDAGEQFFRGTQSKGFDFYSFHAFAREMGQVTALTIGDFTVNMGQGLVQWQSLAFGKSSDVMGIKRQSPVLRPYHSAGEFNFFRGAGITIKKKRIGFTVFVSNRKLSANLVADTLDNGIYVSSILQSGYHRSNAEIEDRNNLRQATFGGNIKYSSEPRNTKAGRFQISVNGIYHNFSMPFRKGDDPYDLYSISGNRWYNMSVDYSYTRKNFHFFGEAAADKKLNQAVIHGVLVSVDPRVDISLLYRSFGKEYRSVYGNTFSESRSPSNEQGLYAGISTRPFAAWRMDMYADIYRFPWLKYQVDAPGYGKDFLTQLTYIPGKQVEIYARYRNEVKQGNQPGNLTVTNYLASLRRQNLRMQVSCRLNGELSIRNRYEMSWYGQQGNPGEDGFLAFFDFIYRPLSRPFSGVMRLQYFETDGYDSRLYAFENDVLYSYSIPVFYDKGLRYYLTFNYNLGKRVSFWMKLAQTVQGNNRSMEAGSDNIDGNKMIEIKIQARYIL